MNNPIYEPRGRAREYGELAVNIYTGCNHGCSYCYAPAVLHRGQEEFAEVQPRPGIVEAVRRQLEREKKTGRTIFLCFTCDPYPAEIDTTPTRAVIQAIKESGNQSYKIGSRSLTKADLGQIRKQIEFWQNRVAQLENTGKRGGRNRVVRVVPRDL